MSVSTHSLIRNPGGLGREIRAARKKQGLTQVELAEVAGVGTRFISELERGKETVRLGLALEITRLVGINLWTQSRWLKADSKGSDKRNSVRDQTPKKVS